jgi:lambda family phage tail tape measure protein
MAADTNATIVRVRAVVEGLPGLNQLKTAMRGISAESKSANVDLRLVNAQLRNLGTETNKSINNLRLQKQAFEAVRNSARIGSDAYKEATLRLKELNRELDKTQAGGGGGGRGRGLATIGTVAGAGFFGGPEALLGAAVGGIFAGPPGAAAGAGIGAGASGLRQQAAGISDYVKELNLAKITLAQASTSQADFNRNLQIARQISTDYSVGLKETVNGYAQVSVAARANGLTVQQTEAIYRGVISASVAFGKSQEDLDAIVRATVQVLSKGKVSAEEMGGQIGERLPGAVAKFAQATGRSLPELAKDFEQGKVTIADFVKFTEKQVNDYDEIAKIIGASPEKAGARLKLALDTAAENYGGFFQNIGAGMQDNLAKMLSWVNKNSEFLKRYAAFWFNLGRDISRAVGFIAGTIFNLGKGIFKVFTDVALFVPRKIAQAFGTTPEKIFGKLTGAVGGALAQYTKNYADYFPEFKVPAGAYGTDQGGGMTGAELPSDGKATKEAEREAKRQEKLLERRNELIRKAGMLQRDITDKTDETSKAMNQLGGNAYTELENKYTKKVDEAKNATGDLLLKVFDLAKEFREAGGNLNISNLVQGIDNLQEAAIGFAQGEYAQDMNKFFRDLDDNISSVNERVYENARAMQYNADVMGGLKDGLIGYGESVGTVREAFANLAESGVKKVENSIFDLVTTGTTNYREFAVAILQETTRMIIQQFILKSIMQSLGFLGGGGSSAVAPLSNVSQYSAGSVGFNPLAFTGGFSFANGGIMTGNGALPLKRYAAGGIATSPQLAMFGEGSRPEAYVPLPDGRTIPVTMKGGGQMGNIVVNVDAGGTSVQGNEPEANKLGEVIGIAIRQELIKQKRPGGLLS